MNEGGDYLRRASYSGNIYTRSSWSIMPFRIIYVLDMFHSKKHMIKLRRLLDSATKFDAATGNHIAILQDVYSISPISWAIMSLTTLTDELRIFHICSNWDILLKSAFCKGTSHSFLYPFYFDVMQSITLCTSSSLSKWCIGKQMTVSAILWALGSLSGAALSNPR